MGSQIWDYQSTPKGGNLGLQKHGGGNLGLQIQSASSFTRVRSVSSPAPTTAATATTIPGSLAATSIALGVFRNIHPNRHALSRFHQGMAPPAARPLRSHAPVGVGAAGTGMEDAVQSVPGCDMCGGATGVSGAASGEWWLGLGASLLS